jgi:methyl halide transferase
VDLRSLKLHLVDRHARVVVVEAAGERGCDLEGERYDRVETAAAPLLSALEARLGSTSHLTLRAISIDPIARVVRVSLEGGESPGARFDGADYDAVTHGLGALLRVAVNEALPRKKPLSGTPSEPSYWSNAYTVGRDGWELGRAAPPLARWFASPANDPRGLRTIVVGCGRGHEAILLARLGAQVVAVDFAPEALVAARALAAKAGVTIDFRERDVFTLAQDPERYQLWVEHCCFCAIDPARRDENLRVAASVLEPGARFTGLFWAHGRPGGPPFTVDEPTLRAHLAPHLSVDHLEIPPDSVPLRQSDELLLTAHPIR